MLNCSGLYNRLSPDPIFSGTSASDRRRYIGSDQGWVVFYDLDESDDRFQSKELPVVVNPTNFLY